MSEEFTNYLIELEPGFVLGGRYKIIKPIGAGGMGAVYLARDTKHQDFYLALKVLYPGLIKTREARERLRNEIVASYRVNHKNVVRAYEYFDEQEIQAYAMEYVDGGDLHARMKTGPMGAAAVTDIMKQAAEGLAAVHAEGIIHRDLKPENILLNRKGEVKITDFGVARLRGSATLTQAGAMVGTPKYLAPEYIETGECDHRGDLYALGVIAYEMIAGCAPFKAESSVTLMMERFKLHAEPLRKVARHCPPALARVIERSMAVNVNQRYQSADELVRDLKLIEEGKDPEIPEMPSGGFELERALLKILGVSSSVAFGRGVAKRGERRILTLLLSSRRFLVFSVILVATISAFITISLRGSHAIGLTELPIGSYSGKLVGLFSDNGEYALRLWRTEAGVYVLLGKSHCAVAPIDEKNEFSCGDLKFRIELKGIEKRSGVGSMTELGWGMTGTFSLAESSEGTGQ